MNFSKNFFTLTILIIIPCFQSITFTTTFNLPTKSYIELKNSFIKDSEINFESGFINVFFNFTTDDPVDIFKLNNELITGNNKDDLLCYKQAIINEKYNVNCSFLQDNSSSSLNHNGFYPDPNYPEKIFVNENLMQAYNTLKTKGKNFYIIDNTQFPSNGTFKERDIKVTFTYTISVNSSSKFYIFTIVVATVLGFIFLSLFICLGILMFKYNEVKKKKRDDIKSNEKTFKRKDSNEESKASSSFNNSFFDKEIKKIKFK